jgi:glycosyltransferase involved in cell wall biosynthesis
MIDGRRVVVVLPAYNAERTLARSCRGIPRDVVDEVLLVDDASRDRTVEAAQALSIPWRRHDRNRGYGANQKTCYQWALARGADVVVMFHPDDQYPAEAVGPLAALVASGACDVALGSRVCLPGAVGRGMPRYKYACNRLWTGIQNAALGRRLSEYHTGMRAYSRRFLLRVPLLENSDDFVFDNQLLVQAVYFGYRIAELPVPARFHAESSSINPWRGAWYGLGVLSATAECMLQRAGLVRRRRFDPRGRGLMRDETDASRVETDAVAT